MVYCDPFLLDGEEEVSETAADGAFSLLGNALEAWADRRPQGYVLPAGALQVLLPDIACYIPGSVETPETSEMLVDLFVPPPGDSEHALFYKMLKAKEGQVHFLYFWRAFGQAARLLAQLHGIERRCDPGERLAEELETLRDALLRRLEMQDEPVYCKQSLTMVELADAVQDAAAMSFAPDFWQDVQEGLRKPMQAKWAGRLTTDELTTVLLSWLKDAAVWQPALGLDDASTESEKAPEVGTARQPTKPECRPEQLPVLVHIYHVGDEKGVQNLNGILAGRYSPIKFGGVFHAGIEVNGLEWSFGMSPSESVPGISCNAPMEHPMHTYRQTARLRPTKFSAEEVANLLTGMIEEYPGDDYHLLRRNCCHFADDFARRLGAGRLPGWVHRLARVGALVDGAMQRVANRSLLPDSDSDDDW